MEVNVTSASPIPSSPSDDTSPWIGGTGLGSAGLGKAGRVRDRLMAENDRLRREMKAEMAKMEELQRTLANQKPRLEALQADNTRLTNIKSMDDNIILRRDRKLTELKAEVLAERTARQAAESRAQDAEQQRDLALDANRHELQQEREKARHATVHAEILQTSHAQLSREYRTRIATSTKSLRELGQARDEDRKRLARLDVVCGQMRQEAERMRSLHADLHNAVQRGETQRAADAERQRTEAERVIGAAASREAENEALGLEMRTVLDKMNWAIRMEHTYGHATSPPPSPPPKRERANGARGVEVV